MTKTIFIRLVNLKSYLPNYIKYLDAFYIKQSDSHASLSMFTALKHFSLDVNYVELVKPGEYGNGRFL